MHLCMFMSCLKTCLTAYYCTMVPAIKVVCHLRLPLLIQRASPLRQRLSKRNLELHSNYNSSGYFDIQELYDAIKILVGSVIRCWEALHWIAKTDINQNGRIGCKEFFALYMDEFCLEEVLWFPMSRSFHKTSDIHEIPYRVVQIKHQCAST